MIGPWRAWQRRRRRKRAFPREWYGHLEQRVPFYGKLPAKLRERFHDDLKVFVWEKHFIPAGGMVITDEVRVVTAAAAVRLTLHLGLSYYDRLTEIVVYPSQYRHPRRDGIVLGEAHNWGTVVLAWDAVLRGLSDPRDGHDTATHEFAHVLDRRSGRFNGTPELRASADYGPWAEVMSRAYFRLKNRAPWQRCVLRDYGATNEAEFFAVATETFFEKSTELRSRAPDLYDELRRFYRCDPASSAAAED